MSTAYIDDFQIVTLHYDLIENPQNYFKTIQLVSNKFVHNLDLIETNHFENHSYYKFKTDRPIDISDKYFIHIKQLKIPVILGKVTQTNTFEQMFDAREHEFGAIVRDNKTTFTVWSPVAKVIKLNINDKSHTMEKLNDGTHRITLYGNYHLQSYHYDAYINHQWIQVNDPYSKGLTLNATESVVIDFNKTNLDGFYEFSRPETMQKDALIYEVHVRDFTMHPNSGVSPEKKGKLLGLIEPHTTTSTGESTGFDYLTRLGITHVELLPINDFARVDDVEFEKAYNWGYDPEYFQTIDGSYSTQPTNAAKRIQELKQVVQAFHEKGIGVILDVVFNHVFYMPNSSFDKLVPGYYFRYHEDGTVSNGTGVGNDTKTERLMMRKFFVDTIKYYIHEFKIDGFRFDLMGTIDIDTMQEIKSVVMRDNPNAFLLGEGWDLATALPKELKTTHENAYNLPEIHFFNDYFRDTLKGNNFNLLDRGYFNGGGRYYERMFNIFIGHKGQLPVNQTVNYVEVHDNHTLFDRINYTSNKSLEEKNMIHQLATVFTILSLGTPFLHAGQEFYRTKYGHGNTYNLSDFINRIDWNRRIKYKEDINLIKRAIQIRNEHRIFRTKNINKIKKRIIPFELEHPLLGILLFDSKSELILLFNPTPLHHIVNLPRMGEFMVILSNYNEDIAIKNFYDLSPFEYVVLKKNL
ncbi:type I pullulanase [Macrococcoides bohemicum]|uniref:Type I pullulanase n=1 Tax=Macrococcoides bohemicum TaxID=1903056 RepID=A0AAJ4PC81_9STAP|nr:type I pullulanase [Macrococcus bohemicus]QYA43338.1 type I pullulanase [Macrococcus bohemicus]TDL39151.1 type I pullulanase [Macrococcus bohemicus]